MNGIGLDASSTYLLTSASDGDLYEWNLNDQPLTTGLSMVSDATAIAFAPNGTPLTVGSAGDLAQYPEELPANQWQEPSTILTAHTAATQTPFASAACFAPTVWQRSCWDACCCTRWRRVPGQQPRPGRRERPVRPALAGQPASIEAAGTRAAGGQDDLADSVGYLLLLALLSSTRRRL